MHELEAKLFNLFDKGSQIDAILCEELKLLASESHNYSKNTD